LRDDKKAAGLKPGATSAIPRESGRRAQEFSARAINNFFDGVELNWENFHGG
jgi:hypothetical protein